MCGRVSCAGSAIFARSHEARCEEDRLPLRALPSFTSARPPRAPGDARTLPLSQLLPSACHAPCPGSHAPFPAFPTQGELLAIASNVGGPKPEAGSAGTPGSMSSRDPCDRPPAVRCPLLLRLTVGEDTCRGVDAYVNPNLVSGGTSLAFSSYSSLSHRPRLFLVSLAPPSSLPRWAWPCSCVWARSRCVCTYLLGCCSTRPVAKCESSPRFRRLQLWTLENFAHRSSCGRFEADYGSIEGL